MTTREVAQFDQPRTLLVDPGPSQLPKSDSQNSRYHMTGLEGHCHMAEAETGRHLGQALDHDHILQHSVAFAGSLTEVFARMGSACASDSLPSDRLGLDLVDNQHCLEFIGEIAYLVESWGCDHHTGESTERWDCTRPQRKELSCTHHQEYWPNKRHHHCWQNMERQ